MKKYPFSESLEDYLKLGRRLEMTDKLGKNLGEAGWERALAQIKQQTRQGKKLMFIGNGGSAAIASHQATDYFKNGGVRALCFNNPALLTCLANDYGYPEVFERPIERFAEKGDIVFAISSSGRSPNILKGAAKAQEKKCFLLTLSGFDVNNPLRRQGSINFYVPSHCYAYVENWHLFICTLLLEGLMAQNAGKQKK